MSVKSEQWHDKCARLIRSRPVFIECLEYFLDLPPSARPHRLVERLLKDSTNVFALILLLTSRRDASPRRVAAECDWLYKRLLRWRPQPGWEAEKPYMLGDVALVLGGCNRLMGNRESAEAWTQTSEGWFTKIPGTQGRIADLGYQCLTLAYEAGDYARVLGNVSSLASVFEQYGLKRHLAKCRILEGGALKQTDRVSESIATFEGLRASEWMLDEPDLLAFATVPLIELYMRRNDLRRAGELFAEAQQLLKGLDRSLLVAEMFAYAGELARQEGRLEDALDFLRVGVQRYGSVGMEGHVARVRLILSETLLALGRCSEAQGEILAALPAMERIGCRPELAAARALLVSIRNRQKPDASRGSHEIGD
jgi:tetratricopeptide (TPR) repeat protein